MSDRPVQVGFRRSPRGESPRRRDHAFTLIELLVVIAIIMVLAAMMMTGIRSSLGSARRTHCAGNLRQIGMALFGYSDDYDGKLPNAHVLGNFGFRVAPGQRDPTDPRSLPERFGLAAVLGNAGYLRGQSPVWVCTGQPHQWMKEGGNCYGFFCTSNTSFLNLSSGKPNNKPLVWDNYMLYPYTTGFRAPADGTPSGYTIDPVDQKPPHEYGIFRKNRARNFVYADGHVTSQEFQFH